MRGNGIWRWERAFACSGKLHFYSTRVPNMGSGTSRGKKVAPACVGEVNVSKSYDDTVRSLRRENHSVKPLKTPNNANSTNSRNHAQQDCHSEGHDSEFSAEDDELDAELDRVLEDYEDKDRFSTRKKTPKKSFIRSKTYGFCNFRRVHSDNDFNSTPQLPTTELSEEPRGQDEGSVEVNSKRGNGVFGHFRKHTPPCHSNQQNVRCLFIFSYLNTTQCLMGY